MSLREEIPLKRRKIIKKSISKLVVLAFAGTILSIVFIAALSVLTESDSPFYVGLIAAHRGTISGFWFSVVALIVGWSPFYQCLYFITYHYEMDDKNVVIRKGVIIKREITLPFSKITDVYVEQDLFDVVLGLYDVYISTPTVESGKFAHIDGLGKRGAVALRQRILDKVNSTSD